LSNGIAKIIVTTGCRFNEGDTTDAGKFPKEYEIAM
jgi:hypothetical protein